MDLHVLPPGMPASKAYCCSQLLTMQDNSISSPSLCPPNPPPPGRHCTPPSRSHTAPSLWAPAPHPASQPPSLLPYFPPCTKNTGAFWEEQSSPKSLFIFLRVNLRLRKGSGMTALGTKAHLETRIMWNVSLHGSPTRPITISSFPGISANFLWGHQKVISEVKTAEVYSGGS